MLSIRGCRDVSGLPYPLPFIVGDATETAAGIGFPYVLPFTVGSTQVLDDIEFQCRSVIAQNVALRQARPLIRLWMNNPDGSPGAIYVGRVDYQSAIKGSFPFKNNTPTQGVLQLRDTDYIAQFLKQIPNNSAYRKNIIITVDFYGGIKRWSGLLDKWNIRTRDYVKFFEVNFNDDLTQLQYLLCPPNPLLPLDVIQFPRDYMLAGPAKWCISMTILVNLLRVEGNLYGIPDDPFDPTQWAGLFDPTHWIGQLDWTNWQCLIKADPWLWDDSSLFTFISSRMNPVDSIIADSLDDAQLTLTYRRVITDDGEVADLGPMNALVPSVQNLALIFEVVDNSNISVLADVPNVGTYVGGTIVDGFVRSVEDYVGGMFEDSLMVFADNQALMPDEYYQPGFMGTFASHPWLVIRDSLMALIQSSDLSWGPSKATSVVVGGDNPMVDAIAKLVIETVGNLLGYVLMGGFSNLGGIASEVIMPFLVGTLAAWFRWENMGRRDELGWIHYWETYQAGADQNVWSLSAMAAVRGGFLAGESETDHLCELNQSWVMPGVHFDIGHRIGGTVDSVGVQDTIWVNQVVEMTPSWDNSDSLKPYTWQIKVGKSNRNLSLGERSARLMKKFSDTIANIGVKIVN